MTQLRSIPRRIPRPRGMAMGLRYVLREWLRPAPPVRPVEVPAEQDFQHLSFTFAVIALSARVACAKGLVDRHKYLAFREAFPLSGGLCGKLRKLFALACESALPVEHHVGQIRQLYPKHHHLHLSLLDRLFRIAASGGITPEEDRMVARISHMLGVSAADYTSLRERHLHPKPHEILGVEKRAKTGALKTRYRELMRRWHPDRYAGEALSPEISMLLQLKVSEIHEAYRVMYRRQNIKNSP